MLFGLILTSTLTVIMLAGCGGNPQHHELPVPALGEHSLLRIQDSELSNAGEVVAALGLAVEEPGARRLTLDPYRPITRISAQDCEADPSCSFGREQLGWQEPIFPGSAEVWKAWQQRAGDTRICGLRFLDAARDSYRLDTFADLPALARASEHRLTHHGACGTCSSLQDLAVYARFDLTRMAADCARRLTFAGRQACMQAIGFSAPCAESWAYNAGHTRRHCARICLAQMGWRAAIFGNPAPATNLPDGALDACLECDEYISGPGFRYSAGRTRRNSGILSEIQRPEGAVQTVTHDYFEEPHSAP